MYPNPYCDCNVCERVRKTGARPRLRSAFMMDENNMIDFGLDILAASAVYNAPLSKVDHVFITHTHDDHFSLDNIGAMSMADKRQGHYPISFYLSEGAYSSVMKTIDALRPLHGGRHTIDGLISMGRLKFIPIRPYTSFLAGETEVFTVESNHRVSNEELAVNYLFNRGQKGKFLYATDTGLYSQKNIDILRGAGADYLIMEGTFGSLPQSRDSTHLNAEHFVEQVDKFGQAGIIKPDAKIYVTHINQCNTFSHEEYQYYLHRNSSYNITVGYDGMVIE